MSSYLEEADKVAAIAARHAVEVDKKGRYPQEAISALKSGRLAGLLISKEMGGLGEGPRAAALVVERLAKECPSTAMVTTMHFSASAVIDKYGPDDIRKSIAAGDHVTTLSLSEAGSRSYFWVPTSTAAAHGESVLLNARKMLTTGASHVDSYVWSSRPTQAQELSTLWFVPKETPGLSVSGGFDGLGLRGNESRPITAEDARIPSANRLGDDGAGFGIMMETVIPYFAVQIAAGSIGIMETTVQRTAEHTGRTYEHSGEALRDLPTIRAYMARMRIRTDCARALLLDTLNAVESGREDTLLRLLEIKAAAAEAALDVTDTAMRVCGGSAFRKDVAVERFFRDSRAAAVMAPTTDQLYDFIGRAVCGMEVF